MVIHEDTIHFNDRPWSVCGYVYDGNIRYSFLVPEDLIFSNCLTENELSDFSRL